MDFKTFSTLKRLEKFSEGYRGIIYTYTEKGQKFAVKVPQEEKLKKAFLKEAKILQYLNSKGVNFVPKVTFVGEDFFVYPFIEGIPLKKLQKENRDNLNLYLRKLIVAAYCLDNLGVFKDEFQRPFTNVLVKGRKIYLIDFERGQLNKKWKNLPQLLQFLVAVGLLNRQEAIELGKLYKKEPKKVVRQILKRLWR
ncbi:MAG: RIO1 family regulatory kinase/ATPase [Aquificota bacterium]